MMQKERKTATDLEHMALEIVRRVQGCGHVEALTVMADPQKGWIIGAIKPDHAKNSDVRRAILIAEADLGDRFDLARDHDSTG